MDVAEPLVAHASEARLSPAIQCGRSATVGKAWVMMCLWAIVPASSKSEMDTVPRQLVLVTNSRRTAKGNGLCQTMGGWS